MGSEVGGVPSEVGTAPFEISELDTLMHRLRLECPWDRDQNERSIVAHAVEEVYELAAAVYADNDDELLDELGDVLCSVVFISLLMEERGVGSLAAVANHCQRKLIRRHPHIFDEEVKRKVSTKDDLAKNWNKVKRAERGVENEVFTEIAETLPGTLYSRKLQVQAEVDGVSSAGTPEAAVQAAQKVLNELGNVNTNSFRLVGDLLFSGVEVARKFGVDPELALRASADRFRQQFEGGGTE
jgi:MazG family protein